MAVIIPYVKQTWTDGVSQASAARLGVLEEGILDVSYAPCVHVTKAAAQTAIVTGTPTAVIFDTERYDQAGNVADTQHDNVTNNTRLTCRYAGVYSITGNIEWSASPTGALLFIRLNGTTTIGEQFYNADSRVMQVTTDWALAVNDYVELIAQQGSGSNKDINKSASYSPEFMWKRVG